MTGDLGGDLDPVGENGTGGVVLGAVEFPLAVAGPGECGGGGAQGCTGTLGRGITHGFTGGNTREPDLGLVGAQARNESQV